MEIELYSESAQSWAHDLADLNCDRNSQRAHEIRECPKPVFCSNRMRPAPVPHPHMSAPRGWYRRGAMRRSASGGQC